MPPCIMSVSWGWVPGEGCFLFSNPKGSVRWGGFEGGVEGCGGQEALCGKCHQHEMFADPYADTHPPTDAHDGPHPA